MTIPSPSLMDFWNGSVLGSVAHALYMTKNPEFSHEQSWDILNYSVQDSSGRYATAKFDFDSQMSVVPNRVVCSVLDENKEGVAVSASMPSTVSQFQGMDDRHLELVADVLQFTLRDVDGFPMPLISTCFWNDGNSLVSAAAWDIVIQQSGNILDRQFQGLRSFDKWVEDFDLRAELVALLSKLTTAKLASPHTDLSIDVTDVSTIKIFSETDEGYEECIASLQEMRFLI